MTDQEKSQRNNKTAPVPQSRGQRASQSRRPRYFRRRFGRRPKVSPLYADENFRITYKNPETLRRFLTDHGKIRPRRQTGLYAKDQRRLAREVKRARHLALLPFTPEHIRNP